MTTTVRRFRGFPAGARATAVPNLFFSDVAPEIDDPAELLVTLYLLYLAGQARHGSPVAFHALATSAPLLRSLDHLSEGGEAAVRRGVDAAARRGTVLRRLDAGGVEWLTLNDAAARRTYPELTHEVEVDAAPSTDAPPSIYLLYEEAIGAISPLIADELRAAEDEYPPAWVHDAFREAVAQNRRSWRYVARILQRWRQEGRNDAPSGRDPSGRASLAGRFYNRTYR